VQGVQHLRERLCEGDGDDRVVVGSDAEIVGGVVEEAALFAEVCDEVCEHGGVGDGCEDAHVFGEEYG